MSELVEKVARAIYESHPAYQGTSPSTRVEWEQARYGISGTECHRQARAALSALHAEMKKPDMIRYLAGVHKDACGIASTTGIAAIVEILNPEKGPRHDPAGEIK